MNIYKLPVDAYNRTHEQTISEDAIRDKLVGKKQKRKELSIKESEKNKRLNEPQESFDKYKAESEDKG